MKFNVKHACLSAAFCLLTHPLLAADGILIVEKSTTGTTTRTSQAQIEKTRMRSESAGPNGTVIMTFDGAAEVLRTIDMQKKTYTEMTKADVDRMGAQMAGANALDRHGAMAGIVARVDLERQIVLNRQLDAARHAPIAQA